MPLFNPAPYHTVLTQVKQADRPREALADHLNTAQQTDVMLFLCYVAEWPNPSYYAARSWSSDGGDWVFEQLARQLLLPAPLSQQPTPEEDRLIDEAAYLECSALTDWNDPIEMRRLNDEIDRRGLREQVRRAVARIREMDRNCAA